VDCNLESISGTAHNYLIEELYIPDSTTAVQETGVGVDTDNDGEVDANKLATIIAFVANIAGDFDVNVSVNEEIQSGELLLVGRVYVDQFGDDDEVLAQVFQGVVVNDATPTFDGTDIVGISPDSPDDIYLCGRIESDVLEAGPEQLQIVFPVPEIGMLNITLSQAQLVGQVTESGWTEVIISGGLDKEEVTNLYETLVPFLNDMIVDDPDTGEQILSMIDDQCDSTQDGCDPLPSGCAADDQVSVDELQCNALLNQTLKPDWDTDGDGEPDLISLALQVVNAVTVTVQE
jgi:hypothetical protein